MEQSFIVENRYRWENLGIPTSAIHLVKWFAGKGMHTRKLMEYFHLYPHSLITSSLFQTQMSEKIYQGILLIDETVIRGVFQELQNPWYQSEY